MTDTTRNVPSPVTRSGAPDLNGKVPASHAEIPVVVTRVKGLVFWIVLLGFGFIGSMLYLAAVLPLQSAVLASGRFEFEGDVRVVDHLEGGILREIYVKEGDRVEEGQILAKLDPTRVRSQIGILRSQIAAVLARQARLDAMASGSETITFPEEFHALLEWDSSLEKVMQRQIELHSAEIQSDRGEYTILEERIAQNATRGAGIEEQIKALNAQFELVAEETDDLESLFKKGLVPKARLFSRQEDKLDVLNLLAQRQSQLQDVQNQIAEVKQRQLQINRSRRNQIAQDQQVLTENLFDLRQRMQNYEDILRRTDIRAPISGRIVGFENTTIGSVVAPGQVLMEIVPSELPYMVEAQVSLADIDEVEVGLDARIRLSAYSFRKTAPVEGKVTYVSADTFYDEAAARSYYKIHVSIPPEAIEDIPNVTAQSGMPVQVMVATGEQTVLTYLLDPVLGSIDLAMREKN